MRACVKIGCALAVALMALQLFHPFQGAAQQAPVRTIQPRTGQGQSPTGAAPASPPAPAASPARFPLVISVSPNSLTQGQAYTLTVVGRDLQPAVQLTFGEGISVQSGLTVQGSSVARVDVQIAPGAQPGRHEVRVRLGQEVRSSQVYIIVNATAAPPPPSATPPSSAPTTAAPSSPFAPSPSGVPPAPAISAPVAAPPAANPNMTSLTPNQWAPGAKYGVSVFGSRFVAGMEIRFGEGVTVGPATVKSSTTAEVTIDVSSSASAGQRTAQIRKDSSQSWAQTGASGWVIAAPKKPSVEPTLTAVDVSAFPLGTIKLKAPEDYLKSTGYTFPLNDDTVFRWEESNPGLAEWFELRIVTDAGKVLMKRRVAPMQLTFNGMNIQIPATFYRPDKPFLDEMLFGEFYLTGSSSQGGTVAHGLGKLILYWEVAGYRTYQKVVTKEVGPGESAGGKNMVVKYVDKKDVQVETSDRRALATPDKPTGLACPGTKKSGSTNNIQMVNLDQGKNQPDGQANVPNYTQDRFQLSGDFMLNASPYASHYDPKNKVASNGYYNYSLSNIFVDWGDGTLESLPLDSKQAPPFSGNTVLRIASPLPTHKYTTTGQKVIRVFQLPEGDIQKVDPGAVVSAYDASQGGGESAGSPYFTVLRVSGVSLAGAPGGVSYADLATHAYMIFCHAVAVDPRKDLAATGLLHLEAIDITGYNGQHKGGAARQIAAGPVTLADPKLVTPQGGTAKIAPATPVIPGAIQAPKGTMPGAPSATTPGAVTAEVSQAAIQAAQSAGGTLLGRSDTLQANAVLTYYGNGKGKTLFTWTLLDREGGTSTVVKSEWDHVGPSPQRDTSKMTGTQAATPSFPDSYGYKPVDSNILDLESFVVGRKYYLRVSAQVGLNDALALTQAETLQLLSTAVQLKKSGSAPANAPTVADVDVTAPLWRPGLYAAQAPQQSMAQEAGASAYLDAAMRGGAKFGVLSPLRNGSSLPIVASVNDGYKKAAPPVVPKTKPYYVSSPLFSFGVVENAPGIPAKILFTTKSGDEFEIRNLKQMKKSAQGRWSGVGSLNLTLYRGFGTPKTKTVAIQITDWLLADDGVHAAKGSVLSAALGEQLDAAGMHITLDKVYGKAHETDLDLTLSATPQDTTIRRPGTTNTPTWKATERLTAQGDWFHQDATPVEIAIGWSGFTLTTSSTAIDLSATKNHAAGAVKGDTCSGKPGNEWAGIHFGGATLRPFLAGLSGQNSIDKQVTNWGIQDGGLCGNADFGSFSATVKGGTVSLAGIHAAAASGNFAATYKNMMAKNPWPGITVKGDAALVDEAGQDPYISFAALTGTPVTKSYKQASVRAEGFTFGSYAGVGWGIKGAAIFGFNSEGEPFAQNVAVNDVVFGMDGIAYLRPEGTTSTTVTLGGKTELGPTPADLVSVTISGFGGPSLDFDFTTTLSVSEVMPVATVPVGYTLSKKSSDYQSDYTSAGPIVTPFSVNVAFPPAQSQVEAKVALSFTGEKTGATQGASSLLAAADLSGMDGCTASASDATPMLVAAGSADGDRYSGSVDLSMYGSPLPAKFQFRLGYQGGKDYWLIMSEVDLPGTPIVPEILHLYKIGGGLGYRFPVDVFKNPASFMTAAPDMNGAFLFMAKTRVGSGDSFLYMFEGTQTISFAGAARLDFGAWLLSASHDGQGSFQGYLEYAGGSFDGGLSGKLSLLSDAIYLEVPEGAATLHFGGGLWYASLGKKAGPRIAGHVLVIDANAYLEMGYPSPGLLVGAGKKTRLSLGDCDDLCAYIETYYAADLGFTLNPLKISGSLGGGSSVGVCFDDIGCPDFGVKYSGTIEIPPPYFGLNFSVSTPCPVDSIDVYMRIIPPAYLHFGVDWCDCAIFDC